MTNFGGNVVLMWTWRKQHSEQRVRTFVITALSGGRCSYCTKDERALALVRMMSVRGHCKKRDMYMLALLRSWTIQRLCNSSLLESAILNIVSIVV